MKVTLIFAKRRELHGFSLTLDNAIESDNIRLIDIQCDLVQKELGVADVQTLEIELSNDQIRDVWNSFDPSKR